MKALLQFYRKLYLYRGFAHLNNKYEVSNYSPNLRLLLAMPKSKLENVLNTAVLIMIFSNKSNVMNRTLLQKLEQVYSNKAIIRILKSNNKLTSNLNIVIQETDVSLWQQQQWYFLLEKCFSEFTALSDFFKVEFNFDSKNNELYMNYWNDITTEQTTTALELAISQVAPMSKQLISTTIN